MELYKQQLNIVLSIDIRNSQHQVQGMLEKKEAMKGTFKVLNPQPSPSDISLGTKLCSTVMHVLSWTVSFPLPRPLPEAVQLIAMLSAGGLCSTLQRGLLRSSFTPSFSSVAPLPSELHVEQTDQQTDRQIRVITITPPTCRRGLMISHHVNCVIYLVQRLYFLNT